MAIAKKPTTERQAQAFITGAKRKRDEPYAITLRLTREFLNRVDDAAKRLQITRSAFIKMALSRAVDEP